MPLRRPATRPTPRSRVPDSSSRPAPSTPPAPQPTSVAGASTAWTPRRRLGRRRDGRRCEHQRQIGGRISQRARRPRAAAASVAPASGSGSRPIRRRRLTSRSPPASSLHDTARRATRSRDRAVRTHRRRQDRRRDRAGGSACGSWASSRWRSPPTRCRSTPGWRSLTGAATPGERARLEHRLMSFLPVDATFSAGQYARAGPRRDRRAARRRPAADRGRGDRAVPAGRADRAEPAPAPARRVRERWLAELEQPRARRPCTRSSPGGRRGRRPRSSPATASGSSASLELLDAGELEPPPGAVASCGPTRCATRRC